MVWMSVLNSNASTESIQYTWYDLFHFKKVHNFIKIGREVLFAKTPQAGPGCRLATLLGTTFSCLVTQTARQPIAQRQSAKMTRSSSPRTRTKGEEGGKIKSDVGICRCFYKVLKRITWTQLFRFSDHSQRHVGEVGFTSKREERKKKA